MSTSKVDVLTFVNAKLHRSETDIDEELKRVLDELADEYLLEDTDESTELASGDASFAVPTGHMLTIAIRLNDGTTDGEPLKGIPGGYKEYRMWIAEGTSADYSEPEYKCEYNGNIYVYPTSNGAYTVKHDYYRTHPALEDDTGTILFGDEFDSVIKYGVTFEVAQKNLQTKQMALWGPRYEKAKQKRIDNMKRQVYVVGGY